MNRNSIRALASAAFLAAAPGARAQEKAPTIGLGVDLVNAAAFVNGGGATPLSIYVPIDLTGFRIEPSLGLFSRSGGGSQSRVELGVGGFVPIKRYAQFTTSAGGRLLLAHNAESPPGGPSDSSNDVYLAGAVAGEWMANAHFSLGVEAQLGFFSNGSLGGAPSTSGVQTTGLVLARCFF
jgi:hypothetical protein